VWLPAVISPERGGAHNATDDTHWKRECVTQQKLRAIHLISAGDAAVMALANGALTWHRNNAFAGRDGAPMRISDSGYSR
jgi:NADH pyrophosphatase NudC (nudix superfamily)